MKILIIQENGRHEKNRHFRECFCLQHAFQILNQECDIWGLGHENYEDEPVFSSYDVIINLENYDETGWVPDLSEVKTKKYLWAVDGHVRGMEPYQREFHRGKYSKILQSTMQLVDKHSVWFPNAYDNILIGPNSNIKKTHDLGFCGNVNTRARLLDILDQTFGIKRDIFVIGHDMVKAVNSYKVHFNCNIGMDVNYRSFETIGCKTALVTNYNEAYEKLGFRHGENCMMYSTVPELLDSVKVLLEDDGLRETIEANGYELAKKHTFIQRAKDIINEDFTWHTSL